MQFAKVNGIVTHYQEIGGPKGRPLLVFVNSLGTDFRIWRDVVVRLAGEMPILTYDVRGHGLSDAGVTPCSMEDMVWDLSALLDHVGAGRVIVCGISMGGMIAQGLHAARPEIVEALILCDTGHLIGEPEFWNERIDAIEALGLDAVADAVMERWFAQSYRDADSAAYQGYRNMLVRQPADAYIGACAAIRDADMTEMARGIDVPTLCIVGEQDMSTPLSLMSDLTSLIEGARLEIMADAGHLPCIEQPENMAGLIGEFCKQLTAGSAGNG